MSVIARRMDDQLVPTSGGELMEQAASRGDLVQRVQTSYATAMTVQRPRQLAKVQAALNLEADFAGESFFYGWGAGKDRIEGPSVDCAMAALRAWGNCAIESLPVQDTNDAWIFSVAFVDLETGVTIPRQFRQSKRWQVFGKLDAERKDDIRFQIGQSKAIRNVVLNAMPKWLVGAAVEKAKDGARSKLEKFIAEKGIATAIDLVLKGLAKHGVKEDRALAKAGVAARQGIQVDQLLMLRSDLNALNDGRDFADELFPAVAADDAADRLAPPPKVTDPSDELLDVAVGREGPAPVTPELKPEKPPVEVPANEPLPFDPTWTLQNAVSAAIINWPPPEGMSEDEVARRASYVLNKRTVVGREWKDISPSGKAAKWGTYLRDGFPWIDA